jgi:hypothetical protein
VDLHGLRQDAVEALGTGASQAPNTSSSSVSDHAEATQWGVGDPCREAAQALAREDEGGVCTCVCVHVYVCMPAPPRLRKLQLVRDSSFIVLDVLEGFPLPPSLSPSLPSFFFVLLM